MAQDNDDCLLPETETTALINANLTTIAAVVSLFLPAMLSGEPGNIVGFGSVAALRGRGTNVAYAAAKRGLESYFESLRFRTSFTQVHVQFYRLGYVDTHLTYGRRLLPLPMTSPQAVAKCVVRNVNCDVRAKFVPSFWWGIALLLRLLPWAIFRRVKS
jgi:short-subunit dehydrogenase